MKGAERAGGSLSASAAPSNSLAQMKKLLDDRRKPFLVIALEGARCVRLDGDELYVEYGTEARHLRDTLAKPENMKFLREVCRDVMGREMGVRLTVGEAAEADAGAPLTQQDEEQRERQRLREMAEQHPSVQQLLKVFGAEIIDVRRVEAEAPASNKTARDGV